MAKKLDYYQITVKVGIPLEKKIRELSKQEGLSMAAWVRRNILEVVKHYKGV